jgi:muconolactone delta-isomerase
MSGAEFLRRWDAGDYREVDIDDVDALPDVVGALPLVRYIDRRSRDRLMPGQ